MIQGYDSENGHDRKYDRFEPQELDLAAQLDEEVALAGGAYDDDRVEGEVGRTM